MEGAEKPKSGQVYSVCLFYVPGSVVSLYYLFCLFLLVPVPGGPD